MMITDDAISRYAEECSSPESPVLRHIHRETFIKTAYPNMLSGPLLGGLLRMISLMQRPRVVLEIGTFTGYSCLCLAEGLAEGGVVHTIERNPEMIAMIRQHLEGQGLGTRIILHEGDALEIIPQLPDPIDLAFIDAEKEEYIAYYEALMPKMRKGGIILADNVLWGGRVVDESIQDKDTRGIRAFNAHVLNDPRSEQVLLPVRDGLSLIRINH